MNSHSSLACGKYQEDIKMINILRDVFYFALKSEYQAVTYFTAMATVLAFESER